MTTRDNLVPRREITPDEFPVDNNPSSRFYVFIYDPNTGETKRSTVAAVRSADVPASGISEAEAMRLIAEHANLEEVHQHLNSAEDIKNLLEQNSDIVAIFNQVEANRQAIASFGGGELRSLPIFYQDHTKPSKPSVTKDTNNAIVNLPTGWQTTDFDNNTEHVWKCDVNIPLDGIATAIDTVNVSDVYLLRPFISNTPTPVHHEQFYVFVLDSTNHPVSVPTDANTYDALNSQTVQVPAYSGNTRIWIMQKSIVADLKSIRINGLESLSDFIKEQFTISGQNYEAWRSLRQVNNSFSGTFIDIRR